MINFKSYNDTTIHFNDGVTIITGENGAGKSTILEAITYALYKKNTKNIIRNGMDEMMVGLTFTEKGNTYKVIRSRYNNKSQSKIYQKTVDDSYELISDSNTETDNIIKEILGMDSDLFLNATYIRQGEITDLISKTASERKKLISRLLGIDILEDCWEKMLQIINSYENKKSLLEGKCSNKESLVHEIESLNNEIVLLQEGYVLKCEDEKSLNDEKTLLDDKIRSLDKMMSEHKLLYANLDNEEREISRLRNEIVALTIKDNELEETSQLRHMLEEQLSSLSIDALKYEMDGLLDETNYCKQENNALQKRLKGLSDASGECPICKSPINDEEKEEIIKEYEEAIKNNKKTIKDKDGKIKGLSRTIKDAESNQKKIIQLNTKLQEQETIKEKIQKNKQEQSEQKTKIQLIKDKINKLEFNKEEYNELQTQSVSLNEKIKETITEKGIMKGKIKQNNTQLKRLEEQLQSQDIIQEELEHIKQYIKSLEEIRESYGKNGVQRKIRATVKPLIQQNTKENFEMFNFQYDDLQLDEDYHITVLNGNDKNSIQMLSGGEQISIALALRIGITETISQGKMECLMLDEPTNYLDSVRVYELSNLLGGISIVPQVIIVTHEQELERIGDTLIKVVKEDGISEVLI